MATVKKMKTAMANIGEGVERMEALDTPGGNVMMQSLRRIVQWFLISCKMELTSSLAVLSVSPEELQTKTQRKSGTFRIILPAFFTVAKRER